MAKRVELKKVSFNIPVKLLEKIKSYSEELGVSYTNGFVFLLAQSIEQKENLNTLHDALDAYDDAKQNDNFK